MLFILSRAKDNNINSMVITVELVSHDGIVKLDKSNYNSTFDKPIALVYDYLNVSYQGYQAFILYYEKVGTTLSFIFKMKYLNSL